MSLVDEASEFLARQVIRRREGFEGRGSVED